ncbi:carbamoyl phosphate synthase [Desulfuromonas versatilis]|uniref:Carbamoyl phosphate synthase n=1 Tax=Desulfuromonas versatilis TaxID=2802975 RepID=A0ABM8HYX6_9BACT|nr:ATP-grasp domain-containing protein [Desulfuromonas versatilis]BCR05811.1 carbamoyl phosphate synthase [Desulfuromonas versatilis]
MESLNVLVTGAGALVGQGVLRSLRMASRPLRLVTADPDHRAAGHWLGHCAYTIPMATDPAFLPRVEEIIQRERISILFIGTDVELILLSRERENLERKFGVRIAVSPLRVIQIADDKWLTAKFFEEEGFPFVRSALSDDRQGIQRLIDTVGFPILVKPRIGARSVGVQIAKDRETLEDMCLSRSDLVAQELLSENQGEFTSGCLVAKGRCRAVVVLKRDLKDGNTYRAYADTTGRFDRRIAAMAERLGVEGPANFQFRIRDGEPVVFEINARFSGTTPLRCFFGFNEVEAWLNHLADGAPIPEAQIRNGVVFRTWSDIFVAPEQLEELQNSGRLETPTCRSHPFVND